MYDWIVTGLLTQGSKYVILRFGSVWSESALNYNPFNCIHSSTRFKIYYSRLRGARQYMVVFSKTTLGQTTNTRSIRHDGFGSCFYSPACEAVTHGSKYMIQGLVALGADLHYMIVGRIDVPQTMRARLRPEPCSSSDRGGVFFLNVRLNCDWLTNSKIKIYDFEAW
jgi:hypothetical protein